MNGRGRIIFFPMQSGYCPPLSEISRLRRLQDAIDGWHASIKMECLKKNLTAYNRMLKKQSMVNLIRSKWKVIEGGKSVDAVA